MEYDKDPIGRAAEAVYALAEKEGEFSGKVKHALTIVEEALETYPLSDICAGFNGGKDCTALLHIFYAAVKR